MGKAAAGADDCGTNATSPANSYGLEVRKAGTGHVIWERCRARCPLRKRALRVRLAGAEGHGHLTGVPRADRADRVTSVDHREVRGVRRSDARNRHRRISSIRKGNGLGVRLIRGIPDTRWGKPRPYSRFQGLGGGQSGPGAVTVRGLPGALSVMVTVAVRLPAAVGVNVTPTEQLWAGSNVLGRSGQPLLIRSRPRWRVTPQSSGGRRHYCQGDVLRPVLVAIT